jgi:hypothetical protein
MPNRPPSHPQKGTTKRRKSRGVWTPKAERLLQLKVTLLDIEPPIWRRILVPDNYSLAELHEILQVAMGWTFSHLHSFRWQNEHWGEPSEEDDVFGTPTQDERHGFLLRFFTKTGDCLLYEYDFGDGWEHQIELERAEPFDPARPVPVCLAGARACPPEDCGGAGGYADILHALKHPRARGRAELLEWLDEYDPEAFDVEAVNRRLGPRPA